MMRAHSVIGAIGLILTFGFYAAEAEDKSNVAPSTYAHETRDDGPQPSDPARNSRSRSEGVTRIKLHCRSYGN
jgi:hypothetical protein